MRLFFSTRTDFSTSYGDETWYANPQHIDLAAFAGGSITLTQAISDPNAWSNGQGKGAFDHLAAFQAATGNIRQVGLAFAGGCFFDVGVGVVNGTGTATLHIQSFTSQ